MPGDAPTMDSGMSDGGSGKGLSRLLNFLDGGNETRPLAERKTALFFGTAPNGG
jgi:hypothetical protein